MRFPQGFPFVRCCELLGLVLAALVVVVGAPAVATAGPSIVRGPYLQSLSARAVTVVWATDVPAACSLAVVLPDGSTTIVAGGSGTTCAVAATSLRPGTAYTYVPRADGVPLANGSSFRTPDPDARASRFLVLGDSGTAGTMQYVIRDRMLATPADFILHTGDMVYPDGELQDFDPKFFLPYRDLLRRMMLWPCLGNHDVHSESGGPWRALFVTPANNPARNEAYYSFDYGSAHVAVMNSTSSTAPGSAQYTFLDRDLGASTARWKFVVFHHTIYSSGVHGSSGSRANLVPLFDKHGVDLVFMGHDHDYERTLPLRGDVVVEPGAGTVYVTTGGGGDDTRSVGTSAFTAYAETGHHFVRVAVDGDTLRADMFRQDGSVGDSFTLDKSAGTPAPRCGDGLVDVPGEQCDGEEHPACAGPCTADCRCAPVCGDERADSPAEACDGRDDAACPGRCLASCRCGEPASFVTLTPVADTAIEVGTEATWDHGATTRFQVDGDPHGIMYLKFDLSAVRAPVVQATLMVYATNGSLDAGNVHPVADSSWIEGDRNGLDAASEGGTGLKWIDVDTNGDQRVDLRDTSPWIPDLTRRIAGLTATAGQVAQADVTAAFQRGADLYTLAVASESGDGATYASREDPSAAKRPRLRLELGGATTTTAPPTTSTTETTTTSTTSTTTTTTTTVTVASSTTTTSTTTTTTTTTTTLPPPARGAVEADVTVRKAEPSTNFGGMPLIEVDDEPVERAFFRVRVSNLAGRPLRTARLRLHVPEVSGAASPSGGRLHPISKCDWDEQTMTWATQPVIDGPEIAQLGRVTAGARVDFDVTAAIAGDGVYCFALQTRSDNGVMYDAREGGGIPPELVIE